MEIPLETRGVNDTQVFDVMISRNGIIPNKILLIRCGLAKMVMDVITFGGVKYQVSLITPYNDLI